MTPEQILGFQAHACEITGDRYFGYETARKMVFLWDVRTFLTTQARPVTLSVTKIVRTLKANHIGDGRYPSAPVCRKLLRDLDALEPMFFEAEIDKSRRNGFVYYSYDPVKSDLIPGLIDAFSEDGERLWDLVNL